MTPFTTNKLSNSEVISIINVGSYKVRTVICSFSFSGVKILGYGEKRQSRLDIINNEINNIAGVCETIGQSIFKAEIEAGVKSQNIIINPFLSNSFFSSKKIHIKQNDNQKKITKKELFKIINSAQTQGLTSIFTEMGNKYGVSKSELHPILADITSIKLDGNKTENLIGQVAEDIKVSLSNMLIPKVNYTLIQDISNFLDKKIIKIIPEEYAITKIGVDQKQVVYLNIGNASASISIAHNNQLKASIRIEIGIQDLLKAIAKNTDKSRGEIIKKLDRSDLFKEEKKVFLSFFTDLITTGISEILGDNVCPYHFLLTGGGANNEFIKEHISKIDFAKYSIKILKNVEFITASIDQIKKITGVEDILKISNINLIAQIVTTQQLLQSKKEPVIQALKKSLENFRS